MDYMSNLRPFFGGFMPTMAIPQRIGLPYQLNQIGFYRTFTKYTPKGVLVKSREVSILRPIAVYK